MNGFCLSTLDAGSVSTVDILDGTDSEAIESFLTLLPSLLIVGEWVPLVVRIWCFEFGTPNGNHSSIHRSFLDESAVFGRVGRTSQMISTRRIGVLLPVPRQTDFPTLLSGSLPALVQYA